MPGESRPSGCGSCEFSRFPADAEFGGGSQDENEYRCLLLGDDEVRRRNAVVGLSVWQEPDLVWGESPLCTDVDWAVKKGASHPASDEDKDATSGMRELGRKAALSKDLAFWAKFLGES